MTSGKSDETSGMPRNELDEPAPRGSRVRPSATSFDTPLSGALDTPAPSAKTRPSNAPPAPLAERNAILPDGVADITPLEGMPKVPSDTLLSAPAPADRWELILEDRLAEFQHRIDLLEARLQTLENAPPKTPPLERPWWPWVVFLLVLAVGWQLLAYLR